MKINNQTLACNECQQMVNTDWAFANNWIAEFDEDIGDVNHFCSLKCHLNYNLKYGIEEKKVDYEAPE